LPWPSCQVAAYATLTAPCVEALHTANSADAREEQAMTTSAPMTNANNLLCFTNYNLT
jgi:hypothetical protein